MASTPFGRTGLTVSTLGLGGASIGGSYGPVVDESEAVRTVQAAVDLGITFIDTAPLSGLEQSEERIGRALADCRGRDKVILATKVGHSPPGPGHDRATTVAAVEASLARLQTDYVPPAARRATCSSNTSARRADPRGAPDALPGRRTSGSQPGELSA